MQLNRTATHDRSFSKRRRRMVVADLFDTYQLMASPVMAVANYSCGTSPGSIVGVLVQDLADEDDITMPTEPTAMGQLVRGSSFRSKDSMISAIHAYHLKNFVEFRTKKSDFKRYHLICKFGAECAFLLRSTSLGNSWRIIKLVAHTCARDIRSCAEAKVTSRVVAEYVAPNMSTDGSVIRPSDIQGQVLRDFGVRLNYQAALAGRNRALKSIYGDHEKSFQMLAKYLFMLEQMNPGSVVDLQTSDDSSFQYCFFSLAASIRAFRACWPIIVIDAIHLKGKYKGVMFVASTKDGNEQIVPLAFGIGDKEKDSSWMWFLEHVRNSLGTPENLLIVSDQHRSIQNAVEEVYPGTPHGFCKYHIQGKLRGFGEAVIDAFHAAANAFKEADFEEHMQNMLKDAPGAHAKLIGIGPVHWAISQCPECRYEFGTSNAVEVLNGRFKWARELPVTSLLEYARNLVQSWFYKRRTKAAERVIEVMPVTDPSDWRIPHDIESRVVGTPSNPKQAGCPKNKRMPSGVPMKGGPNKEAAAEESSTTEDPDMESPNREARKCSCCHNSGHYATTCTAFIQVAQGDVEAEDGTNIIGEKRRRNPKKCGICGIVGHTRRKCQDPGRFA